MCLILWNFQLIVMGFEINSRQYLVFFLVRVLPQIRMVGVDLTIVLIY